MYYVIGMGGGVKDEGRKGEEIGGGAAAPPPQGDPGGPDQPHGKGRK